jgi:polysaccharide chain length determinant protein (PEP-CTERM system associated)
MIRNGEITFVEVKRVLRHNWWILPISSLCCGVFALAIALVLPKRYTSQTTVLVDRPTVPEEYVKSAVTEDLNHRLASMQEQILSRSRLEPIIEKFDLYAKDRRRVHMDDLIERLRSTITVVPLEPMPGTQDRTLPGFNVSVSFGEPLRAQQICTEVSSMFREQNTKQREHQATRTTTFLSTQLEEAKKKLDDQDRRLAALKRQYLGSLPEEEQTNLNLLNGLNSQLEASTQALSRAQQEKVLNESLLAQQVAAWKMMQTGQNPATSEQQLSVLQDQLSVLLSRYTPEHPDVVKLQNQIEELKKRMATAGPKAGDPGGEGVAQSTSEPPEIQQLRAKLRQDQLNISDLAKRQSQIQEQIRVLQARVQASPVVEQQVKEITRDYQAAMDSYNDLLKKRDQSAMSTDLEHEQVSEQFRVLDAPNFPDKPSFPKKSYFLCGGLGFGLIAGIGVMYLIAFTDKALYTERDVELSLRLPVLSMLPDLEVADTDVARRATSGVPGTTSVGT